jgi:hypothetical protein
MALIKGRWFRTIADLNYRGYFLAIDGTALERDCEPVPPIDERLS